jgi:hypothetical protein
VGDLDFARRICGLAETKKDAIAGWREFRSAACRRNLRERDKHTAVWVEGFKRVATSKMAFGTDETNGTAAVWEWSNFQFFDYARLWFGKDPNQPTLTDDETFGNVIVLSDQFWNEIQAHPVPVDLNVVRALADSPANLDFYSWLVWRCWKARGTATIPLSALKDQLGGSENMAIRNFRIQVRKWLAITRTLWPECPARLSDDGESLIISSSQAIESR